MSRSFKHIRRKNRAVLTYQTRLCSSNSVLTEPFTLKRKHINICVRRTSQTAETGDSYDMIQYKSSAVAEIGDRLATIGMGRKVRAAVSLSVGSWVPI